MITVEDINSVSSKYGFNNIYHKIDTSKIGTGEYSDVKYDFCICGHSISGNNHTFTFQILNDNWTGKYFVDASSATVSYDSTTKTLSCTTASTGILLYLYCNNQVDSFDVDESEYSIPDNVVTIDYDELGTSKQFTVLDFDGSSDTTNILIDSNGLIYDSTSEQYIMAYVRKMDYILNLSANLTMGKVNTVTFNPSVDYDADCKATYLDKTVTFKLSDGSFDLDLTDYNSDNNINVNIQILESDVVLGKTVDYKLPVSYVQVDNYAELVNQINSGATIVELIDDITFLDNIYVNNDLMILGNDHELTLGDYGFKLASNRTFKLSHVDVTGGNPVILQRKNSKLDVISCSFTGAKNTQYNNLGSVISCDIDISSLEVVDDFTTNIETCIFTNNHNCILHGGTLNIFNSKYHNTDMNYVDINNSAFLYQVDGSATITDSIFDIDYTSDAYIEDNIDYAQALFMCGIPAIINNATYTDLARDENVNWCNAPYNNKSHLFAKYYYPQISEAVYSSPIEGKEDQSVCYCVSNNDWVYKENVQVTRAATDTQNETRIIIWED